MSEAQTVGQRFTQLITHLGISKNAFAASIGKTATVIQHLVDERNKPGFDLMCKVFEVYPNVSKDWLMLGQGPMLTTGATTQGSLPLEIPAAPVPEKKQAGPKPAPALAAELIQPVAATVEKPAPAEAQPGPATPAAPVAAPQAAPVAPAPLVAAEAPAPASTAAASEAPAPAAADTSWQTALYTQQMAHQLALAELRNQHLQEQQRLMQQMLDLMQRQLPR